ncbi:hypothetical protein MHBO_004961 [Bonamia ostreae]|uniref:Uncharacterized protein n=1 Tax=Bonamia ostreae TaxID=126728 RepID=A0ABV2AUQ9_9EUKA
MSTVTKNKLSADRKNNKRNLSQTSKDEIFEDEVFIKKRKLSKLVPLEFSYIPDPSLYEGGTWREEGHHFYSQNSIC